MKLRDNQKEALQAIITSFKTGGLYHLAVCPTGWGKTILASALMQHALETYGVKCIFLAHLSELVQQTYDKFVTVAPHLSGKTSIFAAGLESKVVSDITIASRQTMARNLDFFDEGHKVSLVIIDEVHLLSEDGEFDKIINHLKTINPRLKVLGVTGTPYRLGMGYIFGDGKRFDKPCYQDNMKDMTDQGYLTPLRYKMVVSDKLKSDLNNIKIVAGEYNQAQLANTMSDRVHLGSVKHAIETYAQDRKSIIVFATNIRHGEMLGELLGAKCVHSKMPKPEWRQSVDDFKSGKSRILVNIGQLSIGFDAPNADCAVLARPTKSPAIFTQQCGRVGRLFDGKADALILDLVGNYTEHGSPYNPIVNEPGQKKDRDPQYNVCPECMELVEPDVLVCPECGASMKEQVERREKRMEQRRLELVEVELNKHLVLNKWVKKGHKTKRGNRGDLYCIKIKGLEKPLFRFQSYQAKEDRVKKLFEEVKIGERYELQEDSFGEWISKTQMNFANSVLS